MFYHPLSKATAVKIYLSLTLMSSFTVGCSYQSDNPISPVNSVVIPAANPNTTSIDGRCLKTWCRGKASFYGGEDGLSGRKTASGERFDPNKLTLAHRTFPFGTRVRIRNTDNGREVVAVVNDRGPHVRGRDLDLSLQAARELGIIGDGIANVQYKVEG